MACQIAQLTQPICHLNEPDSLGNLSSNTKVQSQACLTIYKAVENSNQCKMCICCGHDAAYLGYATSNRYVDAQKEPIVSEPWRITHDTMNNKGYAIKDACN